jgi:hypothetical protein
MLILDVKTRWSSTHQMLHEFYINYIRFDSFLGINTLSLGCALDNHESIETFVLHYKDIRPFELSEDEWSGIELVTNWLKSFQSATTQMSATKTPMLSTTHAIFHGLQGDLQDILRSLPETAAPELKKGLTNAHLKLSDYYYKFDESPYYLWSARKYYLL